MRIPSMLAGAWLLTIGSLFGATVTQTTPIVIERHGPAKEELHLAEELLSRYLLQALDRPYLGGEGETVRFVLQADAIVWSKLDTSKLDDLRAVDGFTIEVAEDSVTIRGPTVLAVSYGVTWWLERDVGIRWLFPGELGQHVPVHERLELPTGTTTIRPDIISRLYTGMLYGSDAFRLPFRQTYAGSPLYEERHFFEAYDYFKSLRLHNLTSISHNMINIFPLAETREQHPYLMPMLADGTRFDPPPFDQKGREYQSWHPCYSHPKAVEIATTKARAAFDSGQMCYSLGINDGLRQKCQCESCQALGPWPAPYYDFVTKVANQLKDQYPPHLLGVLVYGDVRHPAKDLVLPENVLTMITGGSPLGEWSRHASHLGKYEYAYGSGFWIPCFPLAAMAWNAERFRDFGVASFRAEVYPVWAFDGPKVYILSRQLWDLDLDVQAALDDYCHAAFGEGGTEMAAFYRLWADQWEYLLEPDTQEPARMTDMGKWRNSNRQFAAIPPTVFDTANQHLEAAGLAIQAEKARARWEMVATTFRASDTAYRIDRTVEQAFDLTAAIDPDAVRQQLTQLARQRDELQAAIDAHPEWQEGAGAAEDQGGWTVDNDMHSALLTTLFRRRGPDAIDPSTLPDRLKPYAGPITLVPPDRLRDYDTGTYWYKNPDRFIKLQTSADGNVWTFESLPDNPTIETERFHGDLMGQWGMTMTTLRKHQGRSLLRLEWELTGQGGDFGGAVQTMWVAKESDGVPVSIQMHLPDTPTTIRRVYLMEPLGLEDPQKWSDSNLKIPMLWQPRHANARLGGKLTIRQLDLPVPDDSEHLPSATTLDDLLGE